jgi:superfamily II DNA helicase RecQ
MQVADGVVRVVFATVALGMGVNLVGVHRTIHYGAPSSIDFQESGRAGRSGEPSKSTIYWKPRNAPLRKDLSNPRDAEVAAVRHYLENSAVSQNSAFRLF